MKNNRQPYIKIRGVRMVLLKFLNTVELYKFMKFEVRRSGEVRGGEVKNGEVRWGEVGLGGVKR